MGRENKTMISHLETTYEVFLFVLLHDVDLFTKSTCFGRIFVWFLSNAVYHEREL